MYRIFYVNRRPKYKYGEYNYCMNSRILKYHTSRFRFRMSYLASIILIFAGALLYYLNQNYSWYIYTALFGLATIVIAISEAKIRSNFVTLKSDSLTIEIGMLSKK